MSCWDRRWRDSLGNPSGGPSGGLDPDEYQRIDREVEALRASLYEHVPMSSDAMSVLLGQQVSGVQTRIAADGHDVEVKFENGLWQVLDPKTLKIAEPRITFMLHNQGKHDHLALPASSSSSDDRTILRNVLRENV